MDNGEGSLAARSLTFLKIPFGLPHLVRHVGKTDDLILPGLGQRVEGCSLHFHCRDAFCTALCDYRLRLPKWRIGRPTRSDMQGYHYSVGVFATHLCGRVSRITPETTIPERKVTPAMTPMAQETPKKSASTPA